MCFATIKFPLQTLVAAPLSVPFSSGCALRRDFDYAMQQAGPAFSSLLIGMCFATRLELHDYAEIVVAFQFPSHRDVLCDSEMQRTIM